MSTKKILAAALCCAISSLFMTFASAQDKQVTNRYSMKLKEKGDGTYELMYGYKYARFIDLSPLEDLLVPYTYQSDKLNGKLYNKTQTEVVTFKKYDGYELKIAIDKAVTDSPAPVMFYCHGGGWARGDFESGRTLSKYMAQQHGITGVRVSYTLAPQDGANVEVSIQDVLDAVAFIKKNAAQYNIDPSRIGFLGNSAGAHLAACAAMKTDEAKVFVGYSGVYDLTNTAITTKTKDEQRKAYFFNLDPAALAKASPALMLNKKKKIDALIVCGTADCTVECSQSENFAAALNALKGSTAELLEYPYYDHNLTSKSSDKMEEIFFKAADFIAAHL
ncbi:MAG: alpha/beta hydrolase [Candidatus Cryptobacteroides sp.]